MKRWRRVVPILWAGLLIALSAAWAVADVLPPGGTFVDDDESVHEGFIEAIAAEGITEGCNPPANDRYCPTDPVTRAQIATLLGRGLGMDPIFPPEPVAVQNGNPRHPSSIVNPPSPMESSS